MKLTKPKKINKTRLKRQADTLFARIVRQDGACRKCGKTTQLQCAHIISRSYHSTRWSLDNAMCLCQGCHMYFTHHPVEWEIFVLKCIGEEAYKDLKKRALKYNTNIDYEKIISELEKVYEK